MPQRAHLMRPQPRRRLLSAALALAIALAAHVPAQSRNWKPDAAALAQDYSTISDFRNPQDGRLLFWMNSAQTRAQDGLTRTILDNYIILGVARIRISPLGAITFDPIDTITPTYGDSRPLRVLPLEELPPVPKGVITIMTETMRQTLGPMGKGIHWFIFEAGSVRACGTGILTIPFADETYTYETPFPGCGTP